MTSSAAAAVADPTPATTFAAVTDAATRPAVRPAPHLAAVPHPREGATRDLAARHLHGVSKLYAAREDLRGVHAFADVVEESVRWTA